MQAPGKERPEERQEPETKMQKVRVADHRAARAVSRPLPHHPRRTIARENAARPIGSTLPRNGKSAGARSGPALARAQITGERVSADPQAMKQIRSCDYPIYEIQRP